jgi:hypothetical protein
MEELVRFTGDLYVIVGGHIPLKEIREKYGEEIKLDEGKDAEIVSTRYGWVRYEFLGPDNTPDDFDDPVPGDAAWILYLQEKRPKGIVRKVTAITEISGRGL